MELYKKLRDDAQKWREEGYPCSEYPLIEEILLYQFEGEPQGEISLKYLRDPQFQSLEVYWYLRLVLKTPDIVNLYKHYYGDDKSGFCGAFGIPISPSELQWIPDIDTVINRVKTDDDFV